MVRSEERREGSDWSSDVCSSDLASKAALNMMTVQLAYELRDTAIKVNSADPGYTATDLNGHRGTQTIPEGAAEAIRLALLSDDGPTGTYSDKNGMVPW